MSAEKPAMLPWFHRDFLGSTQGWTLEERGAYFMLLGAEWENGPLPHEDTRLAGIIGITPSAFKLLWRTVGRKFKATSAGLVNPRLEEHRQKYIEIIAKKRAAGIAGNAVRWGTLGSNVIPIKPDGGGK